MSGEIKLTPFQADIVRLRREGLTNSEIAYRLGRSSRESIGVMVSYLRRKGVRIPPIPRSKPREREEV